MMEERPPARMAPSEWLAITKYFPMSTFDSDQKSWQVTGFYGNNDTRHAALQRAIAIIISAEEQKNMDARYAKRHVQEQLQESDRANKAALDALAKEYGFENAPSDEEPISSSADATAQPSFVMPEQVELLIPRDAKIRLYPRGMRCDACGFYVVPKDAGKIASLACSRCKSGKLRQISLLFFCDKCGEQQEIAPVGKDPDKDGPSFNCSQSGCDGKLLLIKGKRLTDMSWKCGKCNTEYGQARYMCRFCSNFAEKQYKRMELVPTTKAYLSPLTSTFVYFGFGDDKRTDISDEDISWKLTDSNVDADDKQMLTDLGIIEISVIENVESIMAVYGYAPYGDDVKPRFFKERSTETGTFQYNAYITRTVGKGIMVSLDKSKVAQTVLANMKIALTGTEHGEFLKQIDIHLEEIDNGQGEEAYVWLCNLTKEVLTQSAMTNKKDLGGLFKLLHSVEHLLTYQAAIVTGLEENSFAGMVMLEKCAILLYECANVGAGGTDYLHNEKLLEWINEAISYVRDCRYDCTEGCVKCLYIRDPMCHPFWPHEITPKYIPPNSLLSRELVNSFWGLPPPGGATGAGAS